ncbi:MAG: hypothetical protein IJB16_10380 [Clostridia bacterium]|nr:hypothetical protein [Clostridia bacterium]
MRNENTKSLRDKLRAIIILESSKPYEEMDGVLVKECVDFLMELEGIGKLSKEEIKNRVKNIPFKEKTEKIINIRKKIKAKRIAVIAAVLALLLMLFGIATLASEDMHGVLLRTLREEFFELISDGPFKAGNDEVLLKVDKKKEYSSAEELVRDRGISILYPEWLPDGEEIVWIFYSVYGEKEECSIRSNNLNVGMTIYINKALSEETKADCAKKVIVGKTVYYFKSALFVQANFDYEGDVYSVTADTEDDLFGIIENLKEIK